jgi:5-formyltetrahydrofolate cyclo-ligase
MTPERTPADKPALRKVLCALRAAIPAQRRVEESRAIASRALGLVGDMPPGTALVYGATPDEVDPFPLAATLRSRGWKIAYPRVAGPGELTLHFVVDESALATGAFGLREPTADAERVSAAEMSLVVVPGVGFDDRCVRIGYGGGYYDRLLPTLPGSCMRVGLAFEEQIVDELPVESHDAALDAVVTPTRIIRPAGPR